MPDTAQDFYPDEVDALVRYFQRQTGNPRIEMFISATNPTLWLIGQTIRGGAVPVIAEYEKFDLDLKIVPVEGVF